MLSKVIFGLVQGPPMATLYCDFVMIGCNE